MRAISMLRAAALGLVVILSAGCRGGPPPPTDKTEGVALLRTALEAWQAGETAAALKDKSAVTAVDKDWAGGVKLAKFEIDADGAKPSGYDLSCPVKLWLGDGKKPPVSVRYVVALTPNKVVTRDFGG